MLSYYIVVIFLCQNVFVVVQTQSQMALPIPSGVPSAGVPSVGGAFAARAWKEEVPWQAAIYTKTKMPYMQICGGSLVTTNVVISAAHCFWSDSLQQQLPSSDFAVALGKLYRPWNDMMDYNAIKSDIYDVRIPPRYHGSFTNFQDDLAIVILAQPIQYSSAVVPACLNFNIALDKKHLAEGNLGKTAGWGKTTEDGKASPTLQVVNLPAVDVRRCYEDIKSDFRPAITSDKICAGRIDGGTAVCKGDSGGGLAFPEFRFGTGVQYYLRGVVSTAPKAIQEDFCNIYTYATFTHIAKHENFIRDVLSEASELIANTTQETSAGTLEFNDYQSEDIEPYCGYPYAKAYNNRNQPETFQNRAAPYAAVYNNGNQPETFQNRAAPYAAGYNNGNQPETFQNRAAPYAAGYNNGNQPETFQNRAAPYAAGYNNGNQPETFQNRAAPYAAGYNNGNQPETFQNRAAPYAAGYNNGNQPQTFGAEDELLEDYKETGVQEYLVKQSVPSTYYHITLNLNGSRLHSTNINVYLGERGAPLNTF